MRDLDKTTDRSQWREIIRRRTALLIEAAERVGNAIEAEKPVPAIDALRRKTYEALIRLCEASTQDIRANLRPEVREEIDDLIYQEKRHGK